MFFASEKKSFFSDVFGGGEARARAGAEEASGQVRGLAEISDVQNVEKMQKNMTFRSFGMSLGMVWDGFGSVLVMFASRSDVVCCVGARILALFSGVSGAFLVILVVWALFGSCPGGGLGR